MRKKNKIDIKYILNNLILLAERGIFGEDYKIDDVVIEKSIIIYEKLKKFNFELQINPLYYSRGINFLFSKDDYFFDVNILSDETVNLVEEKGIGFNYEIVFQKCNINEFELVERFNNFKK